MTKCSIGEVIRDLKSGEKKARRRGWKGKWLEYFKSPNEVELPVILLRTNDHESPWFPTHEDLLAEDWETYP